MDELTFIESPTVEIGTNKFINTPIILQYDQTPLIEVLKGAGAGFDIQIPIYHSDGTYLAKVKGSRLFLTEQGKKAGIELKHPDRKSVCSLGGKTLFEIRREAASAVRAQAELYTPDGAFVRCSDGPLPEIFRADRNFLRIQGITMSDCTFDSCRIGIWIRSDGSCGFGCA